MKNLISSTLKSVLIVCLLTLLSKVTYSKEKTSKLSTVTDTTGGSIPVSSMLEQISSQISTGVFVDGWGAQLQEKEWVVAYSPFGFWKVVANDKVWVGKPSLLPYAFLGPIIHVGSHMTSDMMTIGDYTEVVVTGYGPVPQNTTSRKVTVEGVIKIGFPNGWPSLQGHPRGENTYYTM